MQVLRREGFPVPEPVAQSRHTLVMEFIDSFPLRQIEEVADPAALYDELMDLIVRLARTGLIHGDFNEFNLLIREEVVQTPEQANENSPLGTEQEGEAQPGEQKLKLQHNSTVEEQASGKVRLIPILIDFPQMLSTTHQNAKFYFDRDVACIKRFFARRFKYETEDEGPDFEESCKLPEGEQVRRLDVEVEATGFSRKMAKDLERYIEAVGTNESEDHEEGRFIENNNDAEDDDDEDDEVEAQEEEEVDDVRGQEGRQEEEAEGQPIEIPLQQDDHNDEQPDDSKLVEELDHLDVQDRSFGVRGDDGLIPVEVQLPKHPRRVNDEKKSRKKKAGWAI